jgi:hypothetical protein
MSTLAIICDCTFLCKILAAGSHFCSARSGHFPRLGDLSRSKQSRDGQLPGQPQSSATLANLRHLGHVTPDNLCVKAKIKF